MIEEVIRPAYQKWCVNFFARCLQKISPNFITLLSILFGITIPFLLVFHHPNLAVITLLISGYFDTLDGTVARLQNRSSEFGAVFDIVGDRIVEFSIIFGLYLMDPTARGLIAFGMIGSCFFCVTSFLVVGVFQSNDSHKSFYYSPGLMERAEAFAFFIAMMLLPNYFTLLGVIFILLVLWTTFLRVWQFRNQKIKSPKYPH